MKKDYLKRTGQIYALAIQNGISEEELFKYTEQAFAFIRQQKKVIKHDDSRTANIVRVQ
jgi:hypothetical protein